MTNSLAISTLYIAGQDQLLLRVSIVRWSRIYKIKLSGVSA